MPKLRPLPSPHVRPDAPEQESLLANQANKASSAENPAALLFPRPFYTIKELIEFFGFGKTWWHEMIDTGRLPHHRPGTDYDKKFWTGHRKRKNGKIIVFHEDVMAFFHNSPRYGGEAQNG